MTAESEIPRTANEQRSYSLRDLSSAQFWLSKIWGRVSITLLCLLVANLVPSVRQFSGPWGVLLIGMLAPVARFVATQYKQRADSVLRALDLADALGSQPTAVEEADLIEEAGATARSRAANCAATSPSTNPHDSYFASTAPKGPRRLVENVAESSWWSAKLASEARTRYLIATFFLATAAFAGLLLPRLNTAAGSASADVAELAASALVFIAAEWSIATWIGLGNFERQAQRVFDRARPLLEAEESPLLLDALSLASGYFIDRILSPPIPPSVRNRNKDRLNSEWERIRQAFHVRGPSRDER